jgi:CDP-diglyceride synthetase
LGDVVFLSVINLFLIKINSYVTDFIWMQIPMWDNIILGFVTGILAILGDLFESVLKRCAGVKVREIIAKYIIGLWYYFSRSWRIF